MVLVAFEEFLEPCHDFSFVSWSNDAVMVEYLEAEKIDAFAQWDDLAFCWVQFELECFDECFNAAHVLFELLLVGAEDNEIVDVAHVVFCVERVFDELVEFVEVDVGEELARPVPKRHAFAWCFRWVVVEDGLHEPENIVVFDAFVENVEENLVVDGFEVVFDVAFERVADDVIVVYRMTGQCAVMCCLSQECSIAVECACCASSFSACVAVVDESWFVDWLEDVDERVVDDSVAELAFIDYSRLWIAEHESREWLWRVAFGAQLQA